MKRAAIIVTDGATFWVQTITKARHPVVASEQLLADLRLLLRVARTAPIAAEAVARVRALLPEEDEHE